MTEPDRLTRRGTPWLAAVLGCLGGLVHAGPVVARDYGDAPASYGDAAHDLNDTPLIETVTVTNVDENWQVVSLNNAYSTPVVVCSPNLSSTTDPPAVVRVRNATSTSFEVRLQNPGDLATPTPSTVRCLVAESGDHALPDGRAFEAHRLLSTVTDRRGSWVGQQATVTGTYTQPVVLGQVMTFNDTNWSVFWSYDCTNRRNPPTSGAGRICVGKHVGEDTNTTRVDETLGYIIVEQGSGAFGNIQYEAALGADTVRGVGNGPPFSYALGAAYDFAVATQAAMDGSNGGWAILWGADPVNGTQLDLAIDEDQIGDGERNHITEQVAYWAFRRTPTPYIGALRGDRETGSQSNAAADGDDTQGVADEDGVVFRSPAGAGDSIFADVTVTNPTTGNVPVCGWLDVPSGGSVDGSFDASDGICSSAPPGTNVVTFQWSGLPTDQSYTTYARFRVSTAALSTADATGVKTDGEVEDYRVQFDFRPTAVTMGEVRVALRSVDALLGALAPDGADPQALRVLLGLLPEAQAAGLEGADAEAVLAAARAYLDPDGDGRVAVLHWTTVQERGTLGFYAERSDDGGQSWHRLRERLLPGLVVAPLGGEYQLADPGAGPGRHLYRIVELEAKGDLRHYGPYELEVR